MVLRDVHAHFVGGEAFVDDNEIIERCGKYWVMFWLTLCGMQKKTHVVSAKPSQPHNDRENGALQQ